MRIGLDGMPLAQPRTGVGVYTFELARALASATPQDRFELLSPLPFEQPAHKNTLPDNLALVYSSPNVVQRRWWTIGLPSHLRRSSLDLFHGTNYEVPFWKQLPTVVTIHDLSLLLHSNTHKARAVVRARLRLPLNARIATLVVTPSELVRREVCEHLKIRPDKVFAVPLAPRSSFKPMAHTAETRARLGVKDEFLLFVGTIEPRKNLALLMRAFEEILRTTHFRPQLVVAGRLGWKPDEFIFRLTNSTVRDHVLVTGFVTDDELRALYSSCRALIYPSIYEGFGLPPLEAMACGAPVIASRVPSVNETVARVVSATDAHQLTEVIVELLAEEGARRMLSAAGLKHAAKFSWEQTAATTRQVYAAAIKKQN